MRVRANCFSASASLAESARRDGAIKLLGIRRDRSVNHLLQRDIPLGREISNAFARRTGLPKLLTGDSQRVRDRIVRCAWTVYGCSVRQCTRCTHLDPRHGLHA